MNLQFLWVTQLALVSVVFSTMIFTHQIMWLPSQQSYMLSTLCALSWINGSCLALKIFQRIIDKSLFIDADFFLAPSFTLLFSCYGYWFLTIGLFMFVITGFIVLWFGIFMASILLTERLQMPMKQTMTSLCLQSFLTLLIFYLM